MQFLAWFRSLCVSIFQRNHIREELEEELRSHIAHRADDLERAGLSRNEAERRARIEFGAQEACTEKSQAAMGGNFIVSILQDVRFALRILRKSPAFAATAVGTLALAIGANAVVFGILDVLVLKPLRVPQPETLYSTVYGVDPAFQSYPNYADLRERNRSFEDLAADNFIFGAVDTGNDPQLSAGFATSGNYFNALHVQPMLGRFYSGLDEHGFGSAPYLVLSYAYWHSRFHDDRGVVGRTVQVNKRPFTVLGVAPPGFQGTSLFVSPDFFLPIVEQDILSSSNTLTSRGDERGIFEMFGHLRPGVTVAQARADLDRVMVELERAYPKEVTHRQTTLIHPGLAAFSGAIKAFVGGLMLLAMLILVAACANLGGLFGAHAADRAREVALRLALGSTRTRILRQLLTEALLVSLAGGVLGLAGSVALLRRLGQWQPFAGAPVHVPITTGAPIYTIALLLAVVSALLFSLVPIRQVLHTNPYELARGGSMSTLGRRWALRDLLLVTQIAICAVLVTSSIVALRGLVRSLHSNFGFDPQNTMLLGVNLAIGGYAPEQIVPFQKRLVDAVATIPGVERAALVDDYPPLVYASASTVNLFRDETANFTQANVAAAPFTFTVSPGYFEAAGTSLLAGRGIGPHDEKGAPAVAVANRELARRVFGSVTGALGRFVRLQDGTRVELVGVVEDGKYLGLTEDSHPAVFFSSLQKTGPRAYVIVRSRRNSQQLATAMRAKLRDLDPGLPPDVQTWSGLLSVALFPARVATMALGVLGGMGAILSITGIFAMAAYSVSKRLKELGIRVALGARRREVLGTALGRAIRLLGIGSAAGLLLGILASRVLAAIVYQATPRDPLVLAGAVLAMLALGLLATWIPAQRALAINPLELLREE